MLGGFLLAAALAGGDSICDFGAVPDGCTDSTAAIQRAIDVRTASGGGVVRVPAGVFRTYTLSLKDGVELRLERGAVLKGGDDGLKYPEFGPSRFWHSERAMRRNRRAMFYTQGARNVAITGEGTIDGNAPAFHDRNAVGWRGRWPRISHVDIPGRCLLFVACDGVRMEGVTVVDSCGWMSWFLDCAHLEFRRITVRAHPMCCNGDGLHFGGCRDVYVGDCRLFTEDDSMIFRAHQEQMLEPHATERVLVERCVFSSERTNGLRFGWAEDCEIRDVIVRDCVCTGSRRILSIWLPRQYGGSSDDPVRCERDPRFPLRQFVNRPFGLKNILIENCILRGREVYDIRIGLGSRVSRFENVRLRKCLLLADLPATVRYDTTRYPPMDFGFEDTTVMIRPWDWIRESALRVTPFWDD